MRVQPTAKFSKAVRKLDHTDISRVFEAVASFAVDPSHPGLNFEPVIGKDGLYTIRATSALRIFLRFAGPDLYDLVDVGSHDLYR